MENNKKNSSYSLVFGQWLHTIKEYAVTEATPLLLLRYLKFNSCVIIRNLLVQRSAWSEISRA